MRITWGEYKTLLERARAIDRYRWPQIAVADWMIEHFSFDDRGCSFIHPGESGPVQPYQVLTTALQ